MSPATLDTLGVSPWCPLNRNLDGFQGQCGCFKADKKLLYPWEIKPQFLRHLANILVTILTKQQQNIFLQKPITTEVINAAILIFHTEKHISYHQCCCCCRSLHTKTLIKSTWYLWHKYSISNSNNMCDMFYGTGIHRKVWSHHWRILSKIRISHTCFIKFPASNSKIICPMV
jgi:hypothetical protein